MTNEKPFTPSSGRSCVIAGAGIAGLTAATLLNAHGYDVTLLEATEEVGGKAKSGRTPEGNPTEHSFRIYGRTYACLFSILKKIPFSARQVINNLIPAKEVVFATLNGADQVAHRYQDSPDFHPKKWSRWRAWVYWHLFKDITGVFNIFWRSLLLVFHFKQMGLPLNETLRFLGKHLKLFFMSGEELAQLSDISYETYLSLDKYSPKFVEYITSVMKIIVVTRTYANAKSICLSMMLAFLRWGLPAKGYEHFPNVHLFMNGPTSEKFLGPWKKYLEQQGVKFVFNTAVKDLSIDEATKKITAFVLSDGKTISADEYILATPFYAYKAFCERATLLRPLPPPLAPLNHHI